MTLKKEAEEWSGRRKEGMKEGGNQGGRKGGFFKKDSEKEAMEGG